MMMMMMMMISPDEDFQLNQNLSNMIISHTKIILKKIFLYS